MTLEINVYKGEFEKSTNENNEILYRCNFLTKEDDTITLFTTDENIIKPYLALKKYDPCKLTVRLYKSQKGKYGLTWGA